MKISPRDTVLVDKPGYTEVVIASNKKACKQIVRIKNTNPFLVVYNVQSLGKTVQCFSLDHARREYRKVE